MTLNLSSILPICICDKENMIKIKSLVEVIKVENIIDIEKPQYINYLIHNINSNLVISEEALKELSLLSLDKVDKILLKCITDNKNIKEVTYDIIKKYIKDKNYESKGYGFGGIIYEND